MLKICSHFGTCGGCSTQEISYQEELLRKELMLKELFPDDPLSPIIACDTYLEYRNKMEFSFSQSKSGLHFLGLMAKRGRVVDLEECMLCSPWMMEVLSQVRRWWEKTGLAAYFPPKNSGDLRNLILREGKRTGEKMAVLQVAGAQSVNDKDLASFVDLLLSITSFTSIYVRRQIVQKKTPTIFMEEVLHGTSTIQEILYDSDKNPLRFKIRPSSFFQPNTCQAEKLIQKAIKLSELKSTTSFLDLYCGTGTIGIFASKKGGEGIGIELNSDAIRDGNENILLNNVKNLRLIEGDVGKVFPKEISPQVIFVDPPRAGLSSDALAELKNLGPEKIIYISCNPITQARDVLELRDLYKITHVQPIDQFPRTPHIENIIAMDRLF